MVCRSANDRWASFVRLWCSFYCWRNNIINLLNFLIIMYRYKHILTAVFESSVILPCGIICCHVPITTAIAVRCLTAATCSHGCSSVAERQVNVSSSDCSSSDPGSDGLLCTCRVCLLQNSQSDLLTYRLWRWFGGKCISFHGGGNLTTFTYFLY